MKYRKEITIIMVILICLVGSFIHAQKVWSLEECIKYALENNLKIKDLDYAMQLNKEQKKQAYRDLLPTIDGFASYEVNRGRSIDPNSNSFVNQSFFSNDFSLTSTIDIFRGFQKINSIAAAKYLHLAASEDKNQEKFLLAFEVMNAFYDVEFYKGLVLNSVEQKETTELNYTQIKKQIELGLKAESDQYEVEANIANDKLIIEQNKNLMDLALLKLKQLMNLDQRDFDVNFIMEEQETNDTFSVDSVYAKSLEFLPLIKGERFRNKVAKKNVAKSRGELYPRVSFMAGIGSGYYETTTDANNNTIPFKEQIDRNTASIIALRVNVPIFNKWATRSKIKEQKIALQRAENSLKTKEQELLRTIQEAIQNFEAFKVEFEKSNANLKSTELAFRIAQRKYEKGLINFIELSQSQNLFTNAKNQYLQTVMKLKVQEETIKFYHGISNLNTIIK